MSKNAHFSTNDCNLHILNPNDVRFALLFVQCQHSIHTNSQHLQMFVQKTAVPEESNQYFVICVYLSK